MQASAGVSRVAVTDTSCSIIARVHQVIAVRNLVITVRASPWTDAAGASVPSPTNALAASAVLARALVPVAKRDSCLARGSCPPSCASAAEVAVSVTHTFASVVARIHLPFAVIYRDAACVICAVGVARLAAVALFDGGATLHGRASCASASNDCGQIQRVVGN